MSQKLRPIADVTTNDWFNTPLFSKINEITPDDGITEISNSVVNSGIFKVQLSAGVDPGVNTGHILRVRARYADGVVAEDSRFNVSINNTILPSPFQVHPVAETYTTYEFPFPESQAALITDYSNISMLLQPFIVGDLIAAEYRVTWVELEIPSPFTPPVRATIDSIIHPRNVDSIILKDEELDSIMNV